MKQDFRQKIKPKQVAYVITAVVLIAVSGFVLESYILPEESVQVNEQLPQENNKSPKNTSTLQNEERNQESNQSTEAL